MSASAGKKLSPYFPVPKMSGWAVQPSAASSAHSTPIRAAWPAWVGFVMVPVLEARLPAREAAIPKALELVRDNPTASLLLLRAAEAPILFGRDAVELQVEVVREGAEDGAPPLTVLGPGDSFGEIALVRGGARTATVRTRSPVNVLTMERDTFQALFAHVPQVRRVFERLVEDRLGPRM